MSEHRWFVFVCTDPPAARGPFECEGDAQTYAALWLADFRHRIIEATSEDEARYLIDYPHLVE